MKRYFLIPALLMIILLTGCSKNEELHKLELQISLLEEEIEENSREYGMALAELEKTKAENSQLLEELNRYKAKTTDFESKIGDSQTEQVKNQKRNEDLSLYKELKILNVKENQMWYVLEETSTNAQSVSIVGSNIDNMVEEYEEIEIDGVGSGELFKARVIGSIYDFQLVELDWDNDSNKFVEVKTAKEMDEVRNKTIIIKTTLPCGMPVEKIKWKDGEGTSHELFLANDGYGFSGLIIWNR